MLGYKEFIQNLNETRLLTSEFTFGFEFECCVKKGAFLHGKSYDEIKDILTADLYKEIEENEIVSGVEPVCGPDESIKPKQKSDKSFEYDSPAFVCKPYVFQKVVKCLRKWLTEYGCYTNDTCGFHNHIRFKDMTREDMIWLYCNLAMDEKFYEESIRFYDFYFSNDNNASEIDIIFLRNILRQISKNYDVMKNSTETEVYDEYDRKTDELFSKLMSNYLTSEKYRTFRLHPHGTIEWRGPRDFMNNNEIQYISKFYNKLFYVISRFRYYNDLDVLYGTDNIKKSKFLHQICFMDGELLRGNDNPLGYKKKEKMYTKSERRHRLRNLYNKEEPMRYQKNTIQFIRILISDIYNSYYQKLLMSDISKRPDEYARVFDGSDIMRYEKQDLITMILDYVKDNYKKTPSNPKQYCLSVLIDLIDTMEEKSCSYKISIWDILVNKIIKNNFIDIKYYSYAIGCIGKKFSKNNYEFFKKYIRSIKEYDFCERNKTTIRKYIEYICYFILSYHMDGPDGADIEELMDDIFRHIKNELLLFDGIQETNIDSMKKSITELYR